MHVLAAMICAKLKNAKKDEQFYKDLYNLETDEDRVICTLKLLAKYKLISEIPSIPKNAKESESFREQGNRLFVLQDPKSESAYMKILELYTKSIAFAPCFSKELAIAYANRSAVLFEIRKYAECIADIDRALEIDCPDNIKVKIYVRKTECLAILGKPIMKVTFQEAMDLLFKMPSSDVKRKMKKKLCDAYMKFTTSAPVQNKKEKVYEATLPTISSQNPEVPCASDAIAIKYNNKYGRHVVATRKINPGEIICVEKPYTLLLTPDNVYNHCSNCLNVCWVNIPCSNCTYAMYCSDECKIADLEKYHDIECPLFPMLLTTLNMSKLDLLTLRIAIQAVREYNNDWQALKKELQEVDECSEPRTKGFSKDNKFYSNKYRSVYSLSTNKEKRTGHDLFIRALDTCLILYYVATRTRMFGNELPPDLLALAENKFVTFFGGLILRHQQMVPVNCHSFTEEFGTEVIERGNALLPFHSLMNHSCDSNITRTSRPKHVIAYALYPIEKDEQIFDNYGEYYAMSPLKMRQKILSVQYQLNCECHACIYDWPTYFELPSYQKLVTDPFKRNKIAQVMRNFDTYFDITATGDVFDKPYILKDLCVMIEVLKDCVPMPCLQMNQVVETVKRVFDLSGNQFDLYKA